MEIAMMILELIGTLAFALSGAIQAMKRKMDIFGICFLAMTTAVGGGIVRDLILGVTPPMAFVDPIYAFVSVGVAVVVFLPPLRKHLHENDTALLVMDSIGLGVFTVIGVEAGLVRYPDNRWLAIFVGLLTGVGGGVLRDIFANVTPSIFIRHFYACASLCGGILTAMLWKAAGGLESMIIGAITTIVLRLIASHYKWQLPR